MGRRGKREFVQMLRLLENFSHLGSPHHAVQDVALRLGAISFDAVKHLLLVSPGRTLALPEPSSLQEIDPEVDRATA